MKVKGLGWNLGWTILVVCAAILPGAPNLAAQAPDDATRVALEAKISALQPLACAAATSPADPQVATLKSVVDAYAKQYGDVLDKQIAALNGGTALNLSADDQKLIAAARQAKRTALSDICGTNTVQVFAPARAGGGNPPPAPQPSPGDKLEVTPAVIRAGRTEVSEQAEVAVSVKNNNKDTPVGLGVPQVCAYENDMSDCRNDSEIFQVTDAADRCKNPLAPTDQCNLKILFTPKRAFQYNLWIRLPLLGPGGQPLTKPDGSNASPLWIPVQGKGFVDNMAHVEAPAISASHPAMRSVVGLDVAGATSTDTQQTLFVDFALNAPIGWRTYTVCVNAKGVPLTGRHGKLLTDKTKTIRSYEDCQSLRTAKEAQGGIHYAWKDQPSDPLSSRAWWYFNPRITSIPQDATALSSLNVQGFTDNLSGKTTSLVQGIDVQGGVEVMIVKPRAGPAFYGSFKNTKQRLAMAWVTGVGFASPFAAQGNNPTVFTLAAASPLRTQFNIPDPGCPPAGSACNFSNVAFVNQERSRFFRRYYTGLRLKTYHFSKAYSSKDCNPDFSGECEGVFNAYPGVLDLTVGQDEQVSGGHLSRWLFRLDAVYPLPFVPGLHIFGGVKSVFQKNVNSDPVFLPGTSTTPISDPSVFQVRVPQRNRDLYRIGLGVDLLQVITQYKKNASKGAGGEGTGANPQAASDAADKGAGATGTPDASQPH